MRSKTKLRMSVLTSQQSNESVPAWKDLEVVSYPIMMVPMFSGRFLPSCSFAKPSSVSSGVVPTGNPAPGPKIDMVAGCSSRKGNNVSSN